MVHFEKAGSTENGNMFAFMLNGPKFKNTSPCDKAASFLTLHVKGIRLLCRNISSAAGRFLQHKRFPGVF